MPRLLTHRWTLALLAGILVGVLAAVVIPRSGASAPAGPPLTKAPAFPVPDRETRVTAADGSVRVVARTADPGGGPEWAIRVFTAIQSTAAADERSLSSDELRRVRAALPRQRCAQLGRIVDGAFGWIDGGNVFRPAGFGYSQAPVLCGGAPAMTVTTLITDPELPDVRVRGVVAWGLGGPPGAPVDVLTPSGAAETPTSTDGAYVAFVGDDLDRRQVQVRSPRAGGGTELLPKPSPSPRYPAVMKRAPALVPDTAPVVQARAPDPTGGLPYGIAAVRNVDGGWCLGDEGRVVAGRVGRPDRALGTLDESGYTPQACVGGWAELTEAHPIGFGYTGGDDGPDRGGASGTSTAGEIARRSLPGRTAFYGRALPSVRTLTFSTPRDERTIAPSGPAHAFIVEYDGPFPTGSTVITARFADGTTKEIERIGPMPGQ